MGSGVCYIKEGDKESRDLCSIFPDLPGTRLIVDQHPGLLLLSGTIEALGKAAIVILPLGAP